MPHQRLNLDHNSIIILEFDLILPNSHWDCDYFIHIPSGILCTVTATINKSILFHRALCSSLSSSVLSKYLELLPMISVLHSSSLDSGSMSASATPCSAEESVVPLCCCRPRFKVLCFRCLITLSIGPSAM